MKNVNQKSIQADAPTILGAAGGLFVSNSVVPMATKSIDTTTKNGLYKKAAIHLVVAGAAAYGFMAMEGKTGAEKAGQGAMIAIAAKNLVDGVGTVLSSVDAIKNKLAADTSVNKAIKAGFGLACPGDACNQSSNRMAYVPVLNRPRRNNGMRGIPQPYAKPNGAPAKVITY